jgi:hypothetical protein
VNDDEIHAIVADLPPIYCRRCHGFYAAAERHCPTCGPPHTDAPSNGARPELETKPTTWETMDMTDALDGVDPPAADLWLRTDGVPLLYRGAMHWFHGESESCKSWAAQLATAQVLNSGGRVLYIDFEDDVRSVVHRLLALAVHRDTIAKGLSYVRPDEPLEDGRGRITAGGVSFARLLDGEFTDGATDWDLAVVDGVTEAMTIEGLDLNSNADIATWLRRVPVRLAALGAAVVMIDHVTKSRDERGRFAIGGQHKLAGVTGAAYTFTALRPFYRTTDEPVTGTVSVGIVKDRPGHVRRCARDGKIGTLELTAYPDGGVTAALVPAVVEPAPELSLAIRVLEHLELYDGATMRNIEDGVPGGSHQLRSCLKWLAHEDRAWVVVEQKGRSHLHWITDAGREQLGGRE